ncbi:unnamed protein product [Lampetra planeri]
MRDDDEELEDETSCTCGGRSSCSGEMSLSSALPFGSSSPASIPRAVSVARALQLLLLVGRKGTSAGAELEDPGASRGSPCGVVKQRSPAPVCAACSAWRSAAMKSLRAQGPKSASRISKAEQVSAWLVHGWQTVWEYQAFVRLGCEVALPEARRALDDRAGPGGWGPTEATAPRVWAVRDETRQKTMAKAPRSNARIAEVAFADHERRWTGPGGIARRSEVPMDETGDGIAAEREIDRDSVPKRVTPVGMSERCDQLLHLRPTKQPGIH